MTSFAPGPPVKSVSLPEVLPILPLGGVVLLPHGRLPMNIFEPPFLSLIEDSLGHGRLIGLVQPSGEAEKGAPAPLYRIGCAGRITSFSETDDGRFLINLLGVCRFRLGEEPVCERSYRLVRPMWDEFLPDLQPPAPLDFDRARLTNALRAYFKIHGVAADWNVVENTANEQLISSLAMICPLPPNEKQAILEAPTIEARTDLLIALLEMACLGQEEGESARH